MQRDPLTFLQLQYETRKTAEAGKGNIDRAIEHMRKMQAATDKPELLKELDMLLGKAASRLIAIDHFTDGVLKSIHQLALLCHDQSIPWTNPEPTVEVIEEKAPVG